MAGVRECCNEDEPFLWRLSPPPNSFTNHLHDNDHYGGGGCSAAAAACAAGRCNAMSTSRYVQLHIYLSLFKSAMSLPWMAGVVCGGKSYYWHTHTFPTASSHFRPTSPLGRRVLVVDVLVMGGARHPGKMECVFPGLFSIFLEYNVTWTGVVVVVGAIKRGIIYEKTSITHYSRWYLYWTQWPRRNLYLSAHH